jgi:hypothetical protein
MFILYIKFTPEPRFFYILHHGSKAGKRLYEFGWELASGLFIAVLADNDARVVRVGKDISRGAWKRRREYKNFLTGLNKHAKLKLGEI